MTLTVDDIPMEDEASFRLLSEGLNVGVFQLSAPWVRGILRDVRPDCFNDVVALLAMVRPGSLDTGGPKQYARNKRALVTKPQIHPELDKALEPILKDTYGIILYQEEVLAIIKEVTGWGYGEADLIFNAMRKKDVAKLASAKPAFLKASRYTLKATETLWSYLEPFADYSFNKAHAVSYAKITMWTLYLKTHYPKEFIAACMSGNLDENEKIQDYITEAKRLGIDVLPPDINKSGLGFRPTNEGIRYGIGAIKGVGESAVRAIVEARGECTCDSHDN